MARQLSTGESKSLVSDPLVSQEQELEAAKREAAAKRDRERGFGETEDEQSVNRELLEQFQVAGLEEKELVSAFERLASGFGRDSVGVLQTRFADLIYPQNYTDAKPGNFDSETSHPDLGTYLNLLGKKLRKNNNVWPWLVMQTGLGVALPSIRSTYPRILTDESGNAVGAGTKLTANVKIDVASVERLLPEFPVGKFKNIGFWSEDDKVMQVSADVDSFKKAFNGSIGTKEETSEFKYTSGGHRGGSRDKLFDLNPEALVRSCVRHPEVPKHEGKFETLLDMSTGIKWTRQNGVLGQLVDDGRRFEKYSPEKMITRARCYGLGLNCEEMGDDSNTIANLAKTLCEGKPNALTVDNIEMMIRGVQNHVNNLDPKLAGRILTTLGVSILEKADTHLSEPMSIDEWNKVVEQKIKTGSDNEKAKAELLKSEQMKKYVKMVIDFVTRNPQVLHENKDRISNRVHDQTFSQPIKIKDYEMQFVRAVPINKQATYQRELMRSLMVPSFGMVGAFGRIGLPQVVSGFAAGVPVTRGVMAGGGCLPIPLARGHSSDIMTGGGDVNPWMELVNSAERKLAGAGFKLDEGDMAKLRDGASHIHKYEKKLIELNTLLAQVSDLARFYRNDGVIDDPYVREIRLENLKGKEDMVKYLYNSIAQINRCMDANMGDKNAHCQKLTNGVRTILGIAAGGGKGDYKVIG